jgi:FAD/FMN-containing dehydrogenase
VTAQTTASLLRNPGPDADVAARRLSRGFRGRIHLPGDDEYDAQRATWSGALDQRPAIVAEAERPADVRAAVVAAQEHDLALAVQATGHGTHVAADGALLLKTSQMAEVLVDPDRRIAHVGPGARWGDVIAASAPFGLAPLSGTSTTVGVAGYTLGGGLGWLSRKHGFAADSLLRADVVTADGAIVTASADRNADLLWALRGGGGNFGVVTSMELALHPVAAVYAGTALFASDRAAEVLARFRDWTASQPDELTVTVVLSRESVAIRGLYAGEARDAERALGPLWEAAGAPLASTWRPMGYADTGTIGGTAPRHFELYEELSDAVIGAAVDAVTGHDADAVDVRHWGGAMARPGANAGPVGHRDVPFSITVDGPAEAAAPLARHATGGSFLNFLKDPARTRAAYTTADYAALRELKRAYDPDNVLRAGHNIDPMSSQPERGLLHMRPILGAHDKEDH